MPLPKKLVLRAAAIVVIAECVFIASIYYKTLKGDEAEDEEAQSGEIKEAGAPKDDADAEA